MFRAAPEVVDPGIDQHLVGPVVLEPLLDESEDVADDDRDRTDFVDAAALEVNLVGERVAVDEGRFPDVAVVDRRHAVGEVVADGSR
ncbi:hypothetical protein ACFQMM_15775 [Saliphagus sp. GCM10025308]